MHSLYKSSSSLTWDSCIALMLLHLGKKISPLHTCYNASERKNESERGSGRRGGRTNADHISVGKDAEYPEFSAQRECKMVQLLWRRV